MVEAIKAYSKPSAKPSPTSSGPTYAYGCARGSRVVEQGKR